MSKPKKSPYTAAVPTLRDRHPLPEAPAPAPRARKRPVRLIGDSDPESVRLLHALSWAMSGTHGQVLRAGLDALLESLDPDVRKLVRHKLAGGA